MFKKKANKRGSARMLPWEELRVTAHELNAWLKYITNQLYQKNAASPGCDLLHRIV